MVLAKQPTPKLSAGHTGCVQLSMQGRACKKHAKDSPSPGRLPVNSDAVDAELMEMSWFLVKAMPAFPVKWGHLCPWVSAAQIVGCSRHDARVSPLWSPSAQLCGCRMGLMASAALPPPPSSSTPTIPKLGPSLGGNLKGHTTNPGTFPPPPARSSGAALQLTPPLRCGAKTRSSPARRETLPAPALISMARQPGGSRTPSRCCSVAAGQGCSCVSHKHSGDSGSHHCHGTPGLAQCPSATASPCKQHRPQISSSDFALL